MGRSSSDEKQRENYYAQANAAIRTHAPLIPIAHSGWISPDNLAVAYNRAIIEPYADPFGFERFSKMQLQGAEEFVWMQSYEPLSLFCADETDSDTLRACYQIAETLYRYKAGSLQPEPALAESCEPTSDLKTWTCQLRENVHFHDGSIMNANDVVLSFVIQWDAAHQLHRGRLGEFSYFKNFWGAFMNSQNP